MRQILFFILGLCFACQSSKNAMTSEAAGELPHSAAIKSTELKAIVGHFIRAQNDHLQIYDQDNDQTVGVNFVKYLDPVHKVSANEYLVCTQFILDDGQKDEVFDIDFRINSDKNRLTVQDYKIHRFPKFVEGRFIMQSRYDYLDSEELVISKKTR